MNKAIIKPYMQTKIFIIIIIICSAIRLEAHDIESSYKSKVIYYNVVPDKPGTLTVTYKGNSYLSAAYSGDVEIPGSIKYNDKDYTVTGIGKKAFYSCKELKSLILPSSIIQIEKAFYDNVLLDRIELNSTPMILGKEFFYNTPISKRTKDSLLVQNYPLKSAETYSYVMKYMLLLNVAGAEKNGKWGVIDRVGNTIIPFEYDELGEFYEIQDENRLHYAFAILVKKGLTWHLIDINNDILQSFSTKKITNQQKDINEGLKLAKLNLEKGLYISKIDQINSAKSEYIICLNEYILDKSIEKTISLNSIEKEISLFKYDTCIVFKETNRKLVSINKKFGLLDKDGKTWILPCIYEMSPIQDCFLIYDSEKYGLINSIGKAFRCVFDRIIYAGNYNSSSLFFVIYNNKWGLVSNTAILHDCLFDTIGEFNNGIAKTYIKNYIGSIDTTGKEVESIVKNAFETTYKLPDNPIEQKVAAYAEVIKMDRAFNSGYSDDCYNNIGVLCEIAGDKKTALAFYEKAMEINPADQTYIENRKKIKKQIKSENFMEILDVINGVVNAIAENQNDNQINSNNNVNELSTEIKSPKLHQETCSYCKGTGKDPYPSYVASFGKGRSLSDDKCEICNNKYAHYHKVCPSCLGKKYIKRLGY